MFSLAKAFIENNLNTMLSHGLIEIQVRTIMPESEIFFRVKGREVFEKDEACKFWEHVMHTLGASGIAVAVGDEKSWNLIGNGWGWDLFYPK